MKHSRPSKLSRLREAGFLHAHPDRVRDRGFVEQPDFFDSHDVLQVRYELLRAHLVEGDKIAAVCRRFGVSRQTFYKFLARFLEQGSGGLLPGRPGPKGPSKLSLEVVRFAEEQLSHNTEISGAALASQINSQLGACASSSCSTAVVSDRTRERYERLRDRFVLEGAAGLHQDPLGEWFLRDGFLGLVRRSGDGDWVIHAHQAPRRRWSGRTPHEDRALLEAFRWLTGGDSSSQSVVEKLGGKHESGVVCPRFLKDTREVRNDRIPDRGATQPCETDGPQHLRGVCLPG